MTKFKVGDKVRATTNRYGCTTLDNGWEGVVTRAHDNGEFDAKTTRSEDEHDVRNSVVYEDLEPQHFELKADKPTKNQRITTLESQVAELQAEVATLKKAQATPKFAPVTTDNTAVGDKIRVIDADEIGPAVLTNGKVYEVARVDSDGDLYVVDDEDDEMSIVSAEFHAIEKVVTE